ncbi:hypothetical protein GCM10009716_09100 [Streptomyces sodiiphilus]|uniref:Lipoprotein n=1 Tax=Streptomyces sodiiphilus TaxID=226217 RepID=A0ABN2NUN8_9ACTN
MRIAPAAVALLALALITGCSGGGEKTEPEKKDSGAGAPAEGGEQAAVDGPLAPDSLAGDLTFPMDRYRISDEDQRLLEEARNVLVKECMARYGFDHEPSEPRAEALIGPYVYLYGVDDPTLAAEHGYLHPTDLDPNAYVPVPEADLTADEELALYGDQELDGTEIPQTLEAAEAMKGPELNGERVPITGCAGDATLRINRPGEDWVDPTLIFNLENEAGMEADEDERIVEIIGDWAQCMAGHGYETNSPFGVQEDLGLSGDVSGPKAIEVAVKDVECKQEVDLIARWSAVDAEYQEEVIEEHAGILEDYTRQHEERMANARSVLSR